MKFSFRSSFSLYVIVLFVAVLGLTIAGRIVTLTNAWVYCTGWPVCTPTAPIGWMKLPAEWRLRNTLAPGAVTANQMKVRTIGLRECLQRVAEKSGFRDKYRRLGEGRGIGIAGSAYISGAGLPIYWNAMPHSGVQIKVDHGGGVAVFCGSTDIGQGSDSVLAYVVAEELGIRPQDIRVITADTDLTPVDLGSYSSRVTLMTGNAAIQAAQRVREPIFAATARKLDCPLERLRARDRRIWDSADPSRALSFAEAAVLAEAAVGTLGAVGSYTPPRSVAKWKGAGVGPTPTYSYSAAVVELTADRDTGLIRVDKVWIAHDVGKAINPVLVIGQVEGSVYMGLGEALMEQRRLEPLRDPIDPADRLRQVPARRAAAVRYAGTWSEQGYRRHRPSSSRGFGSTDGR